jgi:hypothetical protein
MVTPEHCPHCDFAVPRDETHCPGCRRRIPRRVSSIAPPHLTAPDGTHPYRSLAAPARVARALLHGTGAAAAAVAGTFLARFAFTFGERDADELDGIVQASRLASVCCLVLAAVAALVFATWAVAAHGNLRSLGIADHRFWATRRDGAHRALAMWSSAPALVVLTAAVVTEPTTTAAYLTAATAGMLIASAAAAAHDIVGITTVAHARRAEALARDCAPVAERPTTIDVKAAIASLS